MGTWSSVGRSYTRGLVGTRRVMTDYAGNVMEACHSLPYGNGASGSRIDIRRSRRLPVAFSSRKCHIARTSKCHVNSGPAQDCAASPTEHLFTNKERDAETGNDYFGARYYASSMGRFLTPDWSAKVEPVPYSKLDDPQTLNLYAYVGNNPFVRVDADGHDPMASGGSTGVDNAESKSCKANPGLCKAILDSVTSGGTIQQGRANWAQQQSSNSTTVTLNSRPANIPGGQLLHDVGANHEWISTPDGTDVGMGTAQGVPQSDAPGVKTEVVDHTGQVPTSTQTFTGVDKKALATYTKVGTPTGRWMPGVNDCNTWAHNTINQSTPHDIWSGLPGISTVLYHNVVVYADGSIHTPGGP